MLKVSLNKKIIFSEEMEVDVTVNKLNFNDDDSDIEVLSESEQEDDIFLSKDSGFNDDDGSDIEVLSKSVEEEDAKIFGSCCFSQNLINNFAKSFSTVPPILKKVF
ncbi:hypothetical protein [Spiroplasma endosymbiont of Cleonymus obscurus]|uniref:hypothetical protein n=1 Tax=Spiroplasma endosymbiont of Cleonymus obscurus TaxID=3066324 RepID=UPI0037DC0501